MKFISWNVNGLRAIVNKNFLEVFNELDADFFCLQETKLQAGQIELDLPGYHQYWNYAEKKGYSGTAIFAKEPALNVSYGMGIDVHDQEGRLITLEYPEFFLVTCYTPNSQSELKRLDYRLEWEKAFYLYLEELKKQKPVIICGDLNVAHKNIDLKNWKTNQKNAGFTMEEREAFSHLLANGFVDTFRHFYPDQ
ncbi:MAG TPA: exodeoxyribonuclease III, partial [Enterococcus sp.]|nr:exodeoxyribonuclease III [Enterococcus sp.]